MQLYTYISIFVVLVTTIALYILFRRNNLKDYRYLIGLAVSAVLSITTSLFFPRLMAVITVNWAIQFLLSIIIAIIVYITLLFLVMVLIASVSSRLKTDKQQVEPTQNQEKAKPLLINRKDKSEPQEQLDKEGDSGLPTEKFELQIENPEKPKKFIFGRKFKPKTEKTEQRDEKAEQEEDKSEQNIAEQDKLEKDKSEQDKPEQDQNKLELKQDKAEQKEFATEEEASIPVQVEQKMDRKIESVEKQDEKQPITKVKKELKRVRRKQKKLAQKNAKTMQHKEDSAVAEDAGGSAPEKDLQAEHIQIADEPSQAEHIQIADEPMQAEHIQIADEPMQAEHIQIADEPLQAEHIQIADEPLQAEHIQIADEPMQAEHIQTAGEPLQAEHALSEINPDNFSGHESSQAEDMLIPAVAAPVPDIQSSPIESTEEMQKPVDNEETKQDDDFLLKTVETVVEEREEEVDEFSIDFTKGDDLLNKATLSLGDMSGKDENTEKNIDTSDIIDKMGIGTMTESTAIFDTEHISLDKMIDKAFELKQSGREIEAASIYISALDKKPDHETVFWIVLDLCVIYKNAGQIDLAEDILLSYLDEYENLMSEVVRDQILQSL